MFEENPDNQDALDLTEELTVRWTRAQPIVKSYIATAIRDFNNVEDVVQEVAVAVARSYADSDRSRPFVPWVMGIARHKIADYQRKHFRSKQIFDSDLLETLEEAHREVEPEAADIRQALDFCVDRLQERGQMMIKLRYAHNLKPAQIAERVGLAANTVRVALHRIRKVLSECVSQRLAREGKTP